MPSVVFSPEEEEWIVLGARRRQGGMSGELVLAREEIASVTAVDLRDALFANALFYDGDIELENRVETQAFIFAMPEGWFDLDGPFEDVGFTLKGGELWITLSHHEEWPEDNDEVAAFRKLEKLLKPYATDRGIESIVVAENRYDFMPTDIDFEISMRPQLSGVSVADLFELGRGARKLCKASFNGSVDRETVGDLIRGGGASLLVGQPENNWLDVKEQEYELATLHGKLSLALAVAKFANAEDGGVILIGAKGKQSPLGEVIESVKGLYPAPGTSKKYQQILDGLIYPMPLGLRIDVVDHLDGKQLIVIEIPRQGVEMQPFLVHGAIRDDGKAVSTYISIVQRRGEGSESLHPSAIHAQIAAGRALLRGTWLPPADKIE